MLVLSAYFPIQSTLKVTNNTFLLSIQLFHNETHTSLSKHYVSDESIHFWHKYAINFNAIDVTSKGLSKIGDSLLTGYDAVALRLLFLFTLAFQGSPKDYLSDESIDFW